jgi:hypothetical protein
LRVSAAFRFARAHALARALARILGVPRGGDRRAVSRSSGAVQDGGSLTAFEFGSQKEERPAQRRAFSLGPSEGPAAFFLRLVRQAGKPKPRPNSARVEGSVVRARSVQHGSGTSRQVGDPRLFGSNSEPNSCVRRT